MKTRNDSLDALRGFAILAMVLSGSIAYGDVLPAWMYHAQVPPPLHKFNPSIAGITWVDLVFPFFLFSMGAAMPLSLQKFIGNKKSILTITSIASKRFLLLVFFALFTEHMHAWAISEHPNNSTQLLSLFAFVLLFFILYKHKNTKNKILFAVLQLMSFVAAILLLWMLPFQSGMGFNYYKSDIIIVVLANMAFFGTIIYFITASRPLLRLGILPFVFAVFLAAKETEMGWAKALFNFSRIGLFKFDWLYQFYFLKYLFIIVPGTFAGEWIVSAMKTESGTKTKGSTMGEMALAIISICLVGTNLYGLFARMLFFNVVSTAFLCAMALLLVNKKQWENLLLKKMVSAGSYLLLLGLFFEAYEGGIKKDPSTYSYYFVTSGLAYYLLICFSVFAKERYSAKMVSYLALNGKNPMLAYVAGSLLVLPLLTLTHIKIYWDNMNQNPFLGLLKGVLFTGMVSFITVFFVKRKWFWKT